MCAPVKATLALLMDMGPKSVMEFKKIWSAAYQNFRLLSYWRDGNKRSKTKLHKVHIWRM